jgi:hypothetical protein
LEADTANSRSVQVSLFVAFYDGQDQQTRHYGPVFTIQPGQSHESEWSIEDLGGAPIARFGFELTSEWRAEGTLYIDYVSWKGTPTTTFRQPAMGGSMWRRAWINAFDNVGTRWPAAFHLSQGCGTGLLIQGSRDWQDYLVQATITPMLAKSFGLAARVQGLLRYYALLLGPGQRLQLVRSFDSTRILGEQYFEWQWGRPYKMGLQVEETNLVGFVNGEEVFRMQDVGSPLEGGGVAFVCEEGLITSDQLEVVSKKISPW